MQEESMIPALYYNLRRAFIPLLHDDTYIAMNNVVKLVEELGQDSRQRNKKDKNGMKRHVEDNKNEVDGDNNIEPANKKSKGEECIDGLCYELA
jgi:hypothetical protein